MLIVLRTSVCETRPDIRVRVRGGVIRVRVSDTAIRIRVRIRAVHHTGRPYRCLPDFCFSLRTGGFTAARFDYSQREERGDVLNQLRLASEGETRPDIRARVRGGVIRERASDTAIRTRDRIRAEHHTGRLVAVVVTVALASGVRAAR